MSVIDVNVKVPVKTSSSVPVLNKEPDKACSADQEITASAETTTLIEQHPLADLFGKYGGGYWDELFETLEKNREKENTAASQE